MQFSIYRDLASIAFVRCLSPIAGTSLYAEGSGFSVKSAIARCRSERIEREFRFTHAKNLKIIGIAAHTNPGKAQRHAKEEAFETLLLRSINSGAPFKGLHWKLGGFKIGIGFLKHKFVCLIVFKHLDRAIAVQAVASNPAIAVLKAWVEYRNIRIYQPRESQIGTYTKANKILGSDAIEKIRFQFSVAENKIPAITATCRTQRQDTHFISYLLEDQS